jgi:hypothetical protein
VRTKNIRAIERMRRQVAAENALKEGSGCSRIERRDISTNVRTKKMSETIDIPLWKAM